ncbi:MAG: SRPBCC family protein [Polyangiaceae bacterium]
MSILYVVLGFIAALLVFITTRPAKFHIERSALVQAPPAAVFGLINDFHHWAKWSPWERLDSSMHKSFSGAEAGSGAKYAWAGNNKVGEGNMTITDSRPDELVQVDLEFLKPFRTKNVTSFKLRPAPGGTTVHWISEGENGFAAKAFGLIMNMDKLLGSSFEEGLANLNTAAQS